MAEPYSQLGSFGDTDFEEAAPAPVEAPPLQPLSHRVRKAMSETLVVHDKRNPGSPTVSMFCRSPEKLATMLEFLDTKNADFFPSRLELPERLRKLSELKPGNMIDMKAIHADIKKDPNAHKDFMDVLRVVQNHGDVWLMDMPCRRGKTSHIRKERGLSNCPEQNVTLFGITLKPEMTRRLGREFVETLEEEGLRTRNKVTVEKGEDIESKCREALMQMECTVRK